LQTSENDTATRLETLKSIGELKGDAKEAIPHLLRIVKDSSEDPAVRDRARIALEGGVAVPGLISIVEDPGVDVPGRLRACATLGALDKNATAAVAPLAKILGDEGEDASLRRCAASTIGEIGVGSSPASVTALTDALGSSDEQLRGRAAFSLGELGSAAKPALPKLITALHGVTGDAEARMNAAHALGQIGVRDEKVLRQLTETAGNDPALNVRSAAKASLKKLEEPPLWTSLLTLQDKYPIIRLLVYLVAAHLLFWAITAALFWLAPLSLLWANEKLAPVSHIPFPWFGGLKLPTRYVFAIGFFHHHPRVLDAWVNKHVSGAREEFAQMRVAKENEIYVPISVDFGDGTPSSHFAPADLSSFFRREVSRLLIVGDGGIGKTNLAVELCRRALDHDVDGRLCRSHLMIPVLLEELKKPKSMQASTILARIQSLLHNLAPSADKPSVSLVQHLLKRRRVLPVIDSFSEMHPETRAEMVAAICDGPFNAVIITSRTREDMGDLQSKVIAPQKLVRSNLNLFVQSYLERRGKLQVIGSTREFQYACFKLASIVDKGAVTVLLAKLFADQLIADSERALDDPSLIEFPQTVPDLIIKSIKTLNRHQDRGPFPSSLVIAASQAIAWRCIEETLSPRSISYQSAVEALRDDVVAVEMRGLGLHPDDVTLRSLLEHLDRELGIISMTETHPTRVRFTLDPFSEYLAGLYLLDKFGANQMAWSGFLSKASAFGQKGFVLALRDCCLSKGRDYCTPESVAGELIDLVKAMEAAEKASPAN
jgi:HEAT repeat protein